MSLPADVIHHIFYFLNPCGIVRLRQVSRNFQDISHSQALWKDIYANARLPRPPGPYFWQSTRYLERTLVQSELVSKTWMSQPLKVLSWTPSSWKRTREDLGSWSVVFGRWCVALVGKTVQCYDIDSDTYHSLYDGTDGPSFTFEAYTTSTADGRWTYLLLTINADHERNFRLLAFRVNDDGFSEPEIMDCSYIWPGFFDGRRSIDFRGSAPFITVRYLHPSLVLDHRTRCFYTFPSPQIPDDLANESQFYSTMSRPWYTYAEIVLTKTCIIAVWTSRPSSNVPVIVLIRAFIVPDSALPHNVGELRLTHEAIIHPSGYLHRTSLLRNSMVHPVTGSVNIRLLNVTIPQVGHEQKHMSCLDLTLPKPVSNTDVLPISVHTQHLFESTWTYEHHSISDDGYGLGLLLIETRPPFVQISSARKFTIDASKEECTIAVGDPCPLYLPVESDVGVAFDGTRGRLHYFQWNEKDSAGGVSTFDLA